MMESRVKSITPRGTLIFDYDGTLHDCMRLYGPGFRYAYDWLVENGWAQAQSFSDEWISRWLGWEVRAMWNEFMPELPEEIWKQASLLVGKEMDRILEHGGGALFPHVPETLAQLKDEGFELVFLSNCGEGYRDRHRAVFGLDRWISSYYCVGEFPGLQKWEIYQKHILNHHPAPHIMIGDRFHDIEVATRSHIASVGCLYGYGENDELQCADVVIASFDELPAVIDALLHK